MGEWVEGKKQTLSRQSSSSTTQSFSPPSKLIVPSKLSTLSTLRFSHAATTPLPIYSTWLLLQSSHKKWQLRCPIFSTLPPRSLPGHRWPLPPTKADSPGFCVGQCPGFPSLSQTIHFVALLLIHLPFHSCSRWVPQSYQAFNIRYNLDKNVLLPRPLLNPRATCLLGIQKAPQTQHVQNWIHDLPHLRTLFSSSVLCLRGTLGGQPSVDGGGSCIGTHSMGLGKQWVLTNAEFNRNMPCHPLPKNNCDLLGGHNKLTSAITSSLTYIPFSPRDATPWA